MWRKANTQIKSNIVFARKGTIREFGINACVKLCKTYTAIPVPRWVPQALRVSPIVYIPASINYHKRGKHRWEIWVGEKRAPPPHQLITTEEVWKRMNQCQTSLKRSGLRKNVPLPNFWDRGTDTRLCAYFPTNASTTWIEMTSNLRKLFQIKKNRFLATLLVSFIFSPAN